MRAIIEVSHIIVPLEFQRPHVVHCAACGENLAEHEHWMTYIPFGGTGRISLKPCCSEQCAQAVAAAHIVATGPQ